MGFKCCVPRCFTNLPRYEKDPNVSVHKFPRASNAELLNQWIKAIPRDWTATDLAKLRAQRKHNFRVCSLHFDEKFFVTESQDSNKYRKRPPETIGDVDDQAVVAMALKNRRLSREAVPSIFPNVSFKLNPNRPIHRREMKKKKNKHKKRLRPVEHGEGVDVLMVAEPEQQLEQAGHHVTSSRPLITLLPFHLRDQQHHGSMDSAQRSEILAGTAESNEETMLEAADEQEPQDEELTPDGSIRTIVVDPNPMNEIMKRAEQLRSETSDGVVYPCEFCQKVFKFKYEHERHAKIHSGDRPWQCPECMKTFSRKDNMRAHMKIHTGELVRHICQLCGKSYGRKYDLQVHERVHTGERPFECGSCGKSFISTSRLRAHQLIHCKNIYLPRHVRNKKLHLLKRAGGGGGGGGGRAGCKRARRGSDSLDEEFDDEDEEDCDELEDDDEEEDEQEEEIEEEETEDTTDSRESTSKQDSVVDGGPQIRRRTEFQQLVLVHPTPKLQQQKPQIQLNRPSVNLVTQKPVRRISISVVKSCRKPVNKSVNGNAIEDPLCDEDAKEVLDKAEVENRLRLLEAALMQRKVELAGRGIKAESDGLLSVQESGEFHHADFHVVLPQPVCKDEPAC